MINSLSSELNILRPKMIQSGLEVIAHNLNRKNNHLLLFEFGKTYSISSEGKYKESNRLALYISGNSEEAGWKNPSKKVDFFYLKGAVENIFKLNGIKKLAFEPIVNEELGMGSSVMMGKFLYAHLGEVSQKMLKKFDIKQPVLFADIDIDLFFDQKIKPIQYKELSKFPVVNRDLAILVDKNVSYSQIEQIALTNKIEQLTSVQLFDIFESEKLGAGKKSMAISFTFLDENKTLTDKEIDGFMNKIISGYEKTLQAEIRK
jgi:phenylalanyl-tRNA synthetase beta chain